MVCSSSIEVPVSKHPVDGFFAARLDIGRPSQRIWVSIDSGSPWLWVLNSPGGKKPGFKQEDEDQESAGDGDGDGDGRSTSFKYSDGVRVEGKLVTELVKLESVTVEAGPLVLAENVTENGDPMQRTGGQCAGTLGLTLAAEQTGYEGYRRESIFDLFGEDEMKQENEGPKLKSFFKAFWEEHPEVAKTFFSVTGWSKAAHGYWV